MTVLYPVRRSRPRALRLAAVIVGLVALLLALVALPAAGAQGILDQSNDSGPQFGPFINSAGMAQPITAGRTGTLTQVDLFIGMERPSNDLVVEIQTLNAAGLPSGIVLGGATVPAGQIPPWPGVPLPATSIAFSVPVVAGGRYAIVFPNPGNVVWSDNGPIAGIDPLGPSTHIVECT